MSETSTKLYNILNLQKFNENTFIFHRLEDKEKTYTYKDVLQVVERLLSQFREKIPQFVGIALKLHDHSPASCAFLLAILNHNCHFYPLNTNVPEEFQLRESGAHFCITDEISSEMCIKFHVFDEEFYGITINPAATDDSIPQIPNLCYKICTSGSTGQPKMVHVPYECIAPNVDALSTRLQMSPSDVIFLCAPLTFDPFVIEFFLALRNGSALIITKEETRRAPGKLLQILFPAQKIQCTVLQMTPSLFRLFGIDAIREAILKETCSLRVLVLGGEEFPALKELKLWLTEHKEHENASLKKRIFNIYGITEMSCWGAIHEIDFGSMEDYESIPIGEAIDSETELRIVSGEESILHGEAQGELQLGSVTRKCYIPQKDVAPFLNNDMLFRNTGDLVKRDKNGKIYYIGRTNGTIKRFGNRICLDSIEKKIDLILCDWHTRTVCIWDGESHKLICCLARPVRKGSANDQVCKELVFSNLESFEKPDKFVFIDEVPLTRHGKIDRNRISNMLMNITEPCTPLQIFKNFLSETLALSLPEIRKISGGSSSKKRRKDPVLALSFSSAGGTSFHALSLATEISKLLEHPADQRKLLEMFLDQNVTIVNILEFLQQAYSIRTVNPEELPSLSPTRKKINLCWRAHLGKCIDSSPANSSNQYICVGSHSHMLYTLDALSGNEIVKIELPDRIECKVEFGSAQLAFVGCYDGHLYAYDFLSGCIYWHVNVGGMIKAKPLVWNATVIVANYSSDFNLLSICLKTCNVLWRCKVGSKAIYSSPILVGENAALVCTLDGTYARIDAKNGDILWTRQCNSPIFASPSLVANKSKVVIAEVSGKMFICCAESGEIECAFQADGNIFSNLMVHQFRTDAILIVFGCHDQHIYCLQYDTHTSNGLNLLWKSHLKSTIYATPILLDCKTEQFVVACSTKGLLTLLTLTDGFLAASYDLQGEVFSTPCCISDDKVYLGCRDNFLYCFSIE